MYTRYTSHEFETNNQYVRTKYLKTSSVHASATALGLLTLFCRVMLVEYQTNETMIVSGIYDRDNNAHTLIQKHANQ
jgi:uncharacterized membrane protein YjgN (DUF898 family)